MYSPDERAEILGFIAANQDTNIAEACKQFRVSVEAVRCWRKEAGMPMSSHGGARRRTAHPMRECALRDIRSGLWTSRREIAARYRIHVRTLRNWMKAEGIVRR